MQEIAKEKLQELARKMLTGTIEPGEQRMLEEWMNAHPGNELIWEKEDVSEQQLGNRMFAQVVKDAGISQNKHRKIYWTAAAAIIFLLSITSFLLFTKQQTANKDVVLIEKSVNDTDIAPGSNIAILTLSDGRQIKLEGQKQIADGDLKIQNENNELIYSNQGVASFNTMTTPRGGQYQVRLPDGTRVWLNAASSIKYPTTFTGKERLVELTGEAYFEVAKNKKLPFIVKTKDVDVNVLGTHFNVMSYDDEFLNKTTLLEGSVQLKKGSTTAVLVPGQEGYVNHTSEKIKTTIADTEQVLAWKNGLFIFHKTDIKSIMRQLSRWYDFEVKYEADFESRNFSGMITRNTSLSQVLKMLEMTKDVTFKIEGKNVRVK